MVKSKRENIIDFFVLMYFIACSAYRKGTGFDSLFVKVSFFSALFVIIIANKKIVVSRSLKWVVLFWCFYFISCLWAKNRVDTMERLNVSIQTIGVYVIIPLLFKDKDDINHVIKLIIISLFYSGILLMVRTPLSNYGSQRIGTAIGLHPNGFGLRMAIGAVLSMFLLKNQDNTKTKSGVLIALVVFFSSLALLTGSKKALFVIIGGLLALELYRSDGKKIIVNFVLGIIVLLVVIRLIMYNSLFYNVLGKRIEKTYNTLIGNTETGMEDKSLVERKFYINEAIKLFKDYPILGYGGNNFKTYLRESSYSHIAYSHNNYVELLSTLGIVGFGIYYYIYYYLIKGIIKEKRWKDSSGLLLTILTVILLLLDYGMVSYIENIYSIIIALLDCILVHGKRSGEEFEKQN